MSEAYLHTCIKDDGGTPNRRCYACEEEKAAALAALAAKPDAGLDAAWESFAQERGGMLSASPLGFARQAFYAGAQSTFSALVEAINEPEEEDSIRRMEALANEIGSACEELKL